MQILTKHLTFCFFQPTFAFPTLNITHFKMKKNLLVALGTCIVLSPLLAQMPVNKTIAKAPVQALQKGKITQRTCGTMDHEHMLEMQNPNHKQNRDLVEQQIANYIANQKINPTTQAVMTIPVVFHVVYQNSTENIPDSRLTDQLAALNDDYRKLNSDWTSTPATWQSLVADCEVNFCLATLDPNGNPTTGITRTSTTDNSFSTDDQIKYTSQGGKDAWDRNQYLNIWVGDLGGGLLGYAQFPGGPAATDGVVLHYLYTGTTGAQPPYNLGRTATHEVGHWLGLYHIWGDDGNACTGSDLVSDTPNQASENYQCWSPGTVRTDACSPSAPGFMWMNYMDYTDDACMYMFTNGQKTRITATLNGPRLSLQSSNGCGTQQALDAGIISIVSPVGNVCATTFAPIVTLRNFGSTTLTSVTITYQVDGNPASNYNWTGSLASGGQTNVTLPNITTTAGTHTLTMCTNAPNSGTDGNTGNDCTTGIISVSTGGTPLPYVQGFESTTFVPTGWTLYNPDNSITWERTTAASKTGVASAWIDNWNYLGGNGQQDEMILMPLNLSSVLNPQLTFEVAYVYWTVPYQYSDTLEILISTDCGVTWTTIYQKWGNQLMTATPLSSNSVGWVPNNTEWRKETVSLSTYQSATNAIFKFRNVTDYEDNLYIDDINIDNQSGISEIDLGSLVNIYPNPSSGSVNVSVSLPSEDDISIIVYDVLGKLLLNSRDRSKGGIYTMNLSGFDAGVYFIEIKAGNNTVTRKIILNN